VSVSNSQLQILLRGGLWSLLTAAIIAGPVLLLFSQMSIPLGQYLPVEDISGDYLSAMMVAAILGILILLWPIGVRERIACLSLWLIKMAICLVVMLWYENRYDFLDAYWYFSQSVDADGELTFWSIGSGSNVVIALISGLWALIPESYHTAKIAFAYVGLMSFMFFARAFQLITGRDSVLFLVTLGAIPSMMFWSSILGKDPIILFAMALATYAIARYYASGRSQVWLLLLLTGVVLAALVRPWIGGLMAMAFIVVAIGHVAWSRFGVVGNASACLLVVVLTGVLIDAGSFQLIELLPILEQMSSGWATGGSAINPPVAFASWWDVVSFFPKGAFTALYRPLPGEVGNVFGLLAGIENLVLLGLTFWILMRHRGGYRSPIDGRVIAWLILCVFFWVGIYAFLSYQNLGTAVRFRAQILPICLLLAWSLFPGNAATGPNVSDAPSQAVPE
jgi:hypothetical protein